MRVSLRPTKQLKRKRTTSMKSSRRRTATSRAIPKSPPWPRSALLAPSLGGSGTAEKVKPSLEMKMLKMKPKKRHEKMKNEKTLWLILKD